MSTRDIIVVGASAGGVDALMKLVSGLPADLPAAVFVVLHVGSSGQSYLPEILNNAGLLRAAHAVDNEPIQKGRIYVAPPDFHLWVMAGRVSLSRGATENHHRPAIDPTLRTAADAYHSRVVGVVLSGALDDGTAGLFAVKNRGGLTIVQDPDEALFPDMPRNAMRFVEIDYCLPVNEIAPLLSHLAREEAEMTTGSEEKREAAELTVNDFKAEKQEGRPSPFGCPDCGGVLSQVEKGGWIQYRCRVGHAFSAEGLMAAQSEALDNALWSALRALSEKSDLASRLAARSRESKLGASADMWEAKAREAEEAAELIHRLLLSGKTAAPPSRQTGVK